MKPYISSILVLILMLTGCSTTMNEKKYLSLVNEYLDKTDQALHRLNMELGNVFEDREYWLVKEPATQMKHEVERAIKKIESIVPPEKFNDSHKVLIRFFQAELEFATIFKSYGETGNQEAIATLGQVSEAMANYHAEMIFSKEEYRKKGYEETIDYTTLFEDIASSKVMTETQYLIAISDNIEDFYYTLEFLKTILASSAIVPLKDNADLLYESTQALLDYNNLITPPKAYATHHNAYIELLTYLDLTAESVRTYSRIPNENNLNKINDYIKKIEESINSVTTLQQMVNSNHLGKVEQGNAVESAPSIKETTVVNEATEEHASTPLTNNDRYQIIDGIIFKGDRQKLINDALFYFPVQEQDNEYGVLIYASDEVESQEELPSACANVGDPLYTGNYHVATIDLKTNRMNVLDIGKRQFNTNQDGALIVKGTDNLISILECEGSEISMSTYFYIKNGELVQIENENGDTEFFISHQFAKVINFNILQTSLYNNASEVTGWIFYDFELDFEHGKMRHIKTYKSPVQEEVYWQWLRDEYTPK